jgi:hypothetical protein
MGAGPRAAAALQAADLGVSTGQASNASDSFVTAGAAWNGRWAAPFVHLTQQEIFYDQL